jgi:hypothetical protein
VKAHASGHSSSPTFPVSDMRSKFRSRCHIRTQAVYITDSSLADSLVHERDIMMHETPTLISGLLRGTVRTFLM